MKKFLSILLTITLICAALTCGLPGCGNSKRGDTLRILIDQPHYLLRPESELKALLVKAANWGIIDDPEQVEIQVVANDPMNVEVRNGELTRLKTEIAAGRGPDIFFIGCGNNIYDKSYDYLFQYPSGIMAQHRFLKLDDYIENAEYMEWDKMNPMVMSAGRNKEGQYLLPMSYTFPATVYNMTGQEGDPLGQIDKTTTWEDMCASDDPFIRNAAILYASPSWNRVASILGPLDDGHENITFTQEELRDVYDIGVEQGIEESSTLVVADGVTVKPAETGLPQNYTLDMGRGFTLPEFGHMLPDFSDWEMAIVPLCSREGGVTATVSSYCAISSDTADPERAFRLVDYILSEENQQNSSFNFDMGWNSLPVYDGLMTEDKQLFQAITSLPDPHWFLSDGNYQQFSRVRDLITQAKLFTKADEYVTLGFVREMFPDEHQEDQAEWACREIKMGLAES